MVSSNVASGISLRAGVIHSVTLIPSLPVRSRHDTTRPPPRSPRAHPLPDQQQPPPPQPQPPPYATPPAAIPPRAPVPRSTPPAPATTSAPALRNARTAVSGEPPVVDVSSNTMTRLPATSGPSTCRPRP